MDDMNLTLSMFSSGVASVYAIEVLKRIKALPFIHEHSVAINRWLGIATSGLASLGIHFSYDADAGTLMITGLTIASVWHIAHGWFSQWAMQQVTYAVAVEAQKARRVAASAPAEPMLTV